MTTPTDQTCTVVNNGNREKACDAEPSYRLGLRCANGCLGEGLFEFICEEHKYIAIGPIDVCFHCKDATLEFFPLQELRV